MFKKKTEDETEDWLAHILETINGVTQREFNLGDVAILTRNNKTLAQIADFLLEKGVSTTSQEGLLLVNNLDIKLILATLHACVYTEDEANSAQLFSLLEMKHGNVPDVLARHEFLEEYKSGKRTYKKINIWRYLEHLQGSKPVHSEWNRLSAYEAIIEITKYFCLNTKPNIFLETLKEISFLASRAGHKTVREFLTHWEQKHVKKGKGYSVSTTEDENAVKLMTIHKSKGLEFPVVIYAEPFYHGNTSKIWFDLSETSSPLEVNYSTKIFEDHQGKGFSKVHHQREKEITEQFIDDLNLFYVATTRARNT